MRTLMVGFDSFDPRIFESLSNAGCLPNLTALAEKGHYSRLAVSNPPQTEVSWTSIATGRNPGEHGLFDFVHRVPATYSPYVSILPTRKSIGGAKFTSPYNAKTFFDVAAEDGYPATAMWWPALFPARPARPVQTIPGLGTPDIEGKLGVGMLFTSDPDVVGEPGKVPFHPLTSSGRNEYTAFFTGPGAKNPGRQSIVPSVPIRLSVSPSEGGRLEVDGNTLTLKEGVWSPIFEMSFKIGVGIRIRVVTRVILTRTSPDVRLYALPLQLHPLHSPWPYSAPRRFIKDTWKSAGPFLTLGWPQDTTALEEGCISPRQFMALCESIQAERERVMFHHLDHFKEGVLATIFDSLDRIQHMFRVSRPDYVQAWYERYDAIVGKALATCAGFDGEPPRVLVLSDHGFADYNYKVHLNRRLEDAGYLTYQEGCPERKLKNVNWSRTRAYAVGLNSIYLNLSGREGVGCVPPEQAEETVETLRKELQTWQGPDGKSVISNLLTNAEAFQGPLVDRGPDLVVGYRPGYRASPETALGDGGDSALELNLDHWEADHCINAGDVPGVVFHNEESIENTSPDYSDIHVMAIGKAPEGQVSKPPPLPDTQEDEDIVEKRLKSLGYL